MLIELIGIVELKTIIIITFLKLKKKKVLKNFINKINGIL